jgi:predicted nucleic acid-binding protein
VLPAAARVTSLSAGTNEAALRTLLAEFLPLGKPQTVETTRQRTLRVGDSGALVPQRWPLEVLNGLMMAERRQRIDTPRRQRLADFLRDLPITLDTETTAQVWNATQRLAERFRLTVYDAVYLELAQRRHLPLASLEQDLRKAAAAVGVTLLGSDPT